MYAAFRTEDTFLRYPMFDLPILINRILSKITIPIIFRSHAVWPYEHKMMPSCGEFGGQTKWALGEQGNAVEPSI